MLSSFVVLDCDFESVILFILSLHQIFFNRIKEINGLRKEINRLLSKGMSNIYLNVSIEKNRRSQNVDFLSSKNLSLGQFFGNSNSRKYHGILKLFIAT